MWTWLYDHPIPTFVGAFLVTGLILFVVAAADVLSDRQRNVDAACRPMAPAQDQTASLPASPAEVPDESSVESFVLSEALATHASIKDAFARFLFDPFAALARPLLNDSSEPATAAFLTAFQTANNLEPEQDLTHCPEVHVDAYAGAVRELERRWDTADGNAREHGLDRFTAGERNKIRRAREALDIALSATAAKSEKLAALDAARRLLLGLVELPAQAQQHIQTAIAAAPLRPELTVGCR